MMTCVDIDQYRGRELPATRLLVFARLPEHGRVKTRIAADTSDAAALGLYESMLEDLLHNIGDEDDDLLIEVIWTASGEMDPSSLRRYFGDRRLVRQEGADLGERLATAFNERVYFHRSEKVIAIGTDLPSIDRLLVDTANSLLDSCDWVLGPAEDGGYYLIGCRAGAYFPTVFNGIPWGTDAVLTTQEEHLRAGGRTVALLPTRCDLDTVEDLEASLDESSPRTTSAWRRFRETAS